MRCSAAPAQSASFPRACRTTSRSSRIFKTGAARLALGARARSDVPVRIVPCGLTFIHPARFRSLVLIQYGAPIEVDETWKERFDADPKSAARDLTGEVERALRALTVNAPDWETVRALDAVRRLYQPLDIDIEDRVELARRFNAHYPKVKEEPIVRELMSRVQQYQEEARRAGCHGSGARARPQRPRGRGQVGEVRRPAPHLASPYPPRAAAARADGRPRALRGASPHPAQGRRRDDEDIGERSLGARRLQRGCGLHRLGLRLEVGRGGDRRIVLLGVRDLAGLRPGEAAPARRRGAPASPSVPSRGRRTREETCSAGGRHHSRRQRDEAGRPRPALPARSWDRMSSAPLVVVLHGLARTKWSMRRMCRTLAAAGFEPWTRTYPSRRSSIGETAQTLADWIANEAAGRPLYAVTHSLGGILVRHMSDPRLAWRRIVMLAPPNRGSQLVRALAENRLYRWFYGPAGIELADAQRWPAPPAPFLVIAGTRRLSLANPTSWTVGRAFAADEAPRRDRRRRGDEARRDGGLRDRGRDTHLDHERPPRAGAHRAVLARRFDLMRPLDRDRS